MPFVQSRDHDREGATVYDVLGSLLPLALAVSLSPFPIIVTVLMLLAPRAKLNSLAFLLGWITAVVVVVTALTLVSKALEEPSPDDPNPTAGIIRIVLGVGLLFLAFRKWNTRPAPEADIPLPSWMSSIDNTTPGRSLVTGLLLAGANPKNLLVTAGAAVTIGTGGLTTSQLIGAIAFYTAIASITVLLPVVGYAIFHERMTAPLESIRDWLVPNNSVLMGVLLLVFGFVVIGNGISSF